MHVGVANACGADANEDVAWTAFRDWYVSIDHGLTRGGKSHSAHSANTPEGMKPNATRCCPTRDGGSRLT